MLRSIITVGLAVALAVSVGLIVMQSRRIDSLQADLHTAQAQIIAIQAARDADHRAMTTAIHGRQDAAKQVQHDQTTLQQAADCADDAEYLDAVARMWRDKACARRTDSTSSPAGGL